MFNIKLLFCLLFLLNNCKIKAESPPKRLCANAACTEPISIAKTLQGYPSSDKSELSFPANAEVKIYSKPLVKSDSNFWEGEINGKKGFVPSRFLREIKILKPAKFHVEIKPDNVQSNYEVVDGTTIYSDGNPEVENVENLAEATATPDLNVTTSTEEANIEPSSLVDNVLSSVNNWISGGSNEDDDDDDDDDSEEMEDDEDTEEEDSEENSIEVEKEAQSLLKRAKLEIEPGKENVELKENQDNLNIEATEEETTVKATEKETTESSIKQDDLFIEQENKNVEIDIETKSKEALNKEGNENIKDKEEKSETKSVEIVAELPKEKEVNEEIKPNIEIKTSNITETETNQDDLKVETSEQIEETSNKINDQNIAIEVEAQSETNKIDVKDAITSIDDEIKLELIPTGNIESTVKLDLFDSGHHLKNVEEEISSAAPLINTETTTELPPSEPSVTEIPPQTDRIENITELPAEVVLESEQSQNLDATTQKPEILAATEQEVNVTEEPVGIISDIYNSMFGSTPAPDDVKDSTSQLKEEQPENLDIEKEPLQPIENLEDKISLQPIDDITPEQPEDFVDKIPSSTIQEEVQEPQQTIEKSVEDEIKIEEKTDALVSKQNEDAEFCTENCYSDQSEGDFNMEITYDLISVITITAITVLTFLLGCVYIDKSRKEAPLIAKINKLEKDLLVALKENQLFQEKLSAGDDFDGGTTSEIVENLTYELSVMQNAKQSLEEQIENLEKELENSTEVALELNRMLSDVLSSQNGSDTLIANVEQLQRQLIEQQDTINSVNESLNEKNTENHELRLELEISNKKVTELQAELDKMVLNLLKIEEEKEQQQNTLENEISSLKQQLEKLVEQTGKEIVHLRNEIQILQHKLNETQRNLDVKTNEFKLLEDNVRAVNNNSESLLEMSSVKAELMQLKRENQLLSEHLRQEQNSKGIFEKQLQSAVQEVDNLKQKYEEADKEKLEAQTKLQVLSIYFKEKEEQLQKELNKHEAMWNEQKGEATSTIERIKYMQGELQNYKAQNESLKQEIVAQEVELKSQISILEKKAHENWVTARQAERRLEDAKQEAAQLRNRLTLRERSMNEEKGQNRIQSPLEQNGDLTSHLPPIDTPSSPPLLFGTSRDHMATSPPIPGLPPFLPPPPGVPFMPPPPFMPPLPTIFPGDHRPPPLGRMSSPPPPLNSRYSPDSRAFSPYDRNSPSPLYDSEYGAPSPPPPHAMHRGYSPYNNRRAPPARNTNRLNKGSTHSSASGNSNESLEKINRHHNKV